MDPHAASSPPLALTPPYLHSFALGPPGRGASWPLTACVVLKAALGVGVLSLPGAFSRLGWLPASVVIAALTAAVVYSGSLYTRWGGVG